MDEERQTPSPLLGPASRPQRKRLHHDLPSWVRDTPLFFVTICAEPRGQNHLCHGQISQALWETVTYRESLDQWRVPLFLLMPDHLHMLVSPIGDLRQTICAWKRFTSNRYGVNWQHGFFEHRLRHDESVEQKALYIRENPVRAGLVIDSEYWRFAWEKW